MNPTTLDGGGVPRTVSRGEQKPPPQVKAKVSCELLIVRMAPIAEAAPAACRAMSSLGIASSESRPMMPQTKRISMSAKPWALRIRTECGSALGPAGAVPALVLRKRDVR